MTTRALLICLSVFACHCWKASPLLALEIGDQGVTFDESKFDPDYPQMEHWIRAGVRGGIPLIENLVIVRTVSGGSDSAAINAAINAVEAEGGGAVLLENGTYDINDEVKLKSGVALVGESREGVQCIINPSMTANSGAFEFRDGIRYAGIYRLSIRGGWGVPKYDWNIGTNANNELPGNENISVFFHRVTDCWIDDCNILNSADFPVRVSSDHVTIRNCHIDGVFNKHGGAHGYFFILDGYNLVTKCYITHLRHISLQGDGVRYNVVYDNDFEQEVSFHSGDDGDNLIENNRIHIPADMPNGSPNYFSIMGPWSIQHDLSARPNYIYKNDVIEYNHGGTRPWSDPNIVYFGPHEVKPANPLTNFTPYAAGPPSGGTLYPIVLGPPVVVEGLSVETDSEYVEEGAETGFRSVIAPANATNQSVTWSSADPLIATVDRLGRVAGAKRGETVITATTVDGGFSASVSVTVLPATERTFELQPIEDAYLQNGQRYNTNVLRVESGRRISYLKFDLSEVPGGITNARLDLSVGSDNGSGRIDIDKGNNTAWTEQNLGQSNAPTSTVQLATQNRAFASNETYQWALDATELDGETSLSLIIEHLSGNDVSFISSEGAAANQPRLILTVPGSDMDRWMASHQLYDPLGDEDFDGYDNQTEFSFGTSPRDSTNWPLVTIQSTSSGEIIVSFSSEEGRVYSLEASNQLDSGWLPIRQDILGTGNILELSDSLSTSSRFYRVTVED
ncbi:MAG: Ig-like domain-containing protein [Verrucomicrobiota bacterium]